MQERRRRLYTLADIEGNLCVRRKKTIPLKGGGWGASASTIDALITLKTALYQIWKRGAQGPETRRGSIMPIGRVSGVLEGFWFVGVAGLAGLWLLRGCCGRFI